MNWKMFTCGLLVALLLDARSVHAAWIAGDLVTCPQGNWGGDPGID